MNLTKSEPTIEKGTVLHEEIPFIHILSSKFRHQRCDHCFMQGYIHKCRGCCYVSYCDRFCQKKDWPDHKIECKNIKNIPPGKELPDTVRLLARIINKLKRGGDMEKGFYSSKTKFRTFKDLMSHYNDLKNDQKRLNHILVLSEVLSCLLRSESLPNPVEFIIIYGRVVINSFNILDNELLSIGTGIYLGASTIDHSCKPNSVAIFEGTKLVIRAIENIPKFNWTKIKIAYIDLVRPTFTRRKALQDQYYFTCDCQRCESLSDNESEISMICQNIKCCNEIPTSDAASCETDFTPECSSCSFKQSEKRYKQFIEVVEFSKHQVENMENTNYIDVCNKCLEKQKNLFYKTNILHVCVLENTFECSIVLNQWDYAFEIGKKLTPGYERYLSCFHPVLGLHFMKLAKIANLINRTSEAVDFLSRAQCILNITHGKSHSLYKKTLREMLNAIE